MAVAATASRPSILTFMCFLLDAAPGAPVALLSRGVPSGHRELWALSRSPPTACQALDRLTREYSYQEDGRQSRFLWLFSKILWPAARSCNGKTRPPEGGRV